jgi:hypothetical protein
MQIGCKTVRQSQNSVFELFVILPDKGKSIIEIGYPKILEACLPLGNLVFGGGVQAHCEIAIWMKSVGDPIVGELAFSYRVNDENRGQAKAHKRADKFFKQLQIELVDWLEIGSTKTALIYGKPE